MLLKQRVLVISLLMLLTALIIGGLAPLSSLKKAVVLESNATLLYTIAHFSDVQTLSRSFPETLNYTFQWVEEKRSDLNVVAIIVTGDLVDDHDDLSQWRNYLKAKSLTSIPVYEVAGNHDNYYGKDFSYYNRFIGFDETFYAVNLSNSFMLIGVSWNDTSNMVSESMVYWFRDVIERNSDKYFIIATHYYMNGDRTLSPLGRLIHDNLCYNLSNVVIVLCGHVHTRLFNVRDGVHEFITNIQGANQSFIRLFKVYSDSTVVVELWRLKPEPEGIVESISFSLPIITRTPQQFTSN